MESAIAEWCRQWALYFDVDRCCLPTLSIQCVRCVHMWLCLGGCDRRCVWCVNVRCFIHSWDHEFNKSLGTRLALPAVVNSSKFRAITHGIHASPSLPPLTLSPHISTPKAMCECVKKPLPVFRPMVWLHSDSIFMSALFSHWFHINNFSANTHLWLNEH